MLPLLRQKAKDAFEDVVVDRVDEVADETADQLGKERLCVVEHLTPPLCGEVGLKIELGSFELVGLESLLRIFVAVSDCVAATAGDRDHASLVGYQRSVTCHITHPLSWIIWVGDLWE